MRYEILNDNGDVINIIEATADFVEAYHKDHYRQLPDLPPIQTWFITKVAMISRFTMDEYIGIVTATKTDPAVQAWYDMFQAAGNVNLKDARCISGIGLLVSKNLITQERADEILTTPAKPDEIPA